MLERNLIQKAVSSREYRDLVGLKGRKYQDCWVLFQRYILTKEGHLYPLSKWKDTPNINWATFFSVEDVGRVLPDFTIQYSYSPLPLGDDYCFHCGKRFEVLDANEASIVQPESDNCSDYDSDPPVIVRKWCHKKCAHFERRKAALKEACEACDDALGVGQYLLTVIPNEYMEDASDPWFLAETQTVTFKFGLRKRVINLDWSAWEEGPDGRHFAPFKGFEVTKDKRSIHAWSSNDFKQHLRALYHASLRSPEQTLRKGLETKDAEAVERALRSSVCPGYVKPPYLGPRIPRHLLEEALAFLREEGSRTYLLPQLKDAVDNLKKLERL